MYNEDIAESILNDLCETLEKDDIPKSMHLILELIGMKSTLTLILKYRGQNLYIPKDIKYKEGKYVLSCLFNQKELETLSFHFGGTSINIPMATSLFCRIRNKEIINKKNTQSAASLAKEYQLTQRQIWNILRWRTNELQQELSQAN